MSKIHTTLHKKGDSSVDVYPNIESENIPSNAITSDKIIYNAITTAKIVDGAVTSDKLDSNAVTTGKIASNSVTSGKLDSNAVTTAKIANSAVTETKIANNAVTTAKIIDGAVTSDKLDSVLFSELNALMTRMYLFYIGDSNDTNLVLGGSFIVSDYMYEFLQSDINSAFDFDKSQSDYTTTDLEILTEFVNGISGKGYRQSLYTQAKCEIKVNENTFTIKANSDTSYEIKYVNDQGVTRFDLEWNPQTFTITNYVNDDYIYISINLFANFNALG